MAKKQNNSPAETNKATTGEQGMLMEVGPEGMEKIRPHVEACCKAKAARKRAWDKVIEEKENIRLLVLEENLSPAPDGKIAFKCDGVTVEVTPRTEQVDLKEAKEE
jgi:hypothetical protein